MRADELSGTKRRGGIRQVLWRLCALLCPLLATFAWAGVPVIDNIQVTDVATRSFAVALHSSEPVAVSGAVFRNCSSAVTGAAVSFANNSTSGNIRISISGLSAATSYCYKPVVSSLASGEQGYMPVIPVATASQVTRDMTVGSSIMPFANDLVRVPGVFLAPGETQSGVLVTLNLMNGASLSPLSLLLTPDTMNNYLNLNNLFAKVSLQSLNLTGGERVKVTERHGKNGCVIERFRTIPADGEVTAAKDFARVNPTDIDASGGVNILDVLRVVGGKGTSNTGPCFNSDLDINGDGVIDSKDLIMIKDGFNGLP